LSLTVRRRAPEYGRLYYQALARGVSFVKKAWMGHGWHANELYEVCLHGLKLNRLFLILADYELILMGSLQELLRLALG